MICGIVENDPQYAADLRRELLSSGAVKKVQIWPTGEQFWRSNRSQLRLCFVDIGLPGISGIDLIALLRAHDEALPCIVISALHDDETIIRAIEAGAEGYIWKGDLRNVAEALRIVDQGGAIITPAIAVRLLHNIRARSRGARLQKHLTDREMQVFVGIAEGRNPAQVGALLGTSEGTVRNQIKSIYRKLAVRNRVELMRAAARFGLLRDTAPN